MMHDRGRRQDAKVRYRALKRKYSLLVFENEFYHEEVRNLQRKLLKLSRDNNFLLDRLLQYERVSDSSDGDSEATLMSDDEPAPSGASASGAHTPVPPKADKRKIKDLNNSTPAKIPRRRNTASTSSAAQKRRLSKVKTPDQKLVPAGGDDSLSNVQDIQVCLQKLSPELLQQFNRQHSSLSDSALVYLSSNTAVTAGQDAPPARPSLPVAGFSSPQPRKPPGLRLQRSMSVSEPQSKLIASRSESAAFQAHLSTAGAANTPNPQQPKWVPQQAQPVPASAINSTTASTAAAELLEAQHPETNLEVEATSEPGSA